MLKLKHILYVVFPLPQFGVILQALTELDENLPLSSISWSFYKDILEHKVHIWIFIKPFFVKLVQMFYSASRDQVLYVLLNSFTLGLQFAVASACSVNLSTDEQTVLKDNDISKAGVVFFGCVLSEDKLWPAFYTFLGGNWLRPNAIAVSLNLSVLLTGINKDSFLLVILACGGF